MPVTWTVPDEHVEVAIVGGGPAGATLATRLARLGHEVIVLERAPTWRWRAGGVFTSPATVAALRRLGLSDAVLAVASRGPIPAMRVETPAGTTFRLTYGADAGGPPAVGFDRAHLDPALLDLARAAGADVRPGWEVTNARPDQGRLTGRARRRPVRADARRSSSARTDRDRSSRDRAASRDRPGWRRVSG